MPAIKRVVFESEKPVQKKNIQQSDSDQGCQQAPKIRSDCVNQAPAPKNDANAFVTPQCNNNAVASTKMTPNNTGMCIDVNKKVLYDLPEVFEDFLRAYAGLLVEVYEDSGVCLSRA